MANSNRGKKTVTVTDKLLHPQLQIVKAIIRDLLAEYDSNEVKKTWKMICQES